MIRSIADFAMDWEYETEATRKVLARLTDESLPQAVVPGGRTLGILAWHLVTTMPEMLGEAGIVWEGKRPTDEVPTAAAAIGAAYDSAAAQALALVSKNWTAADLSEQIPMYGEKWPRGIVLSALMNHQTHHRGQMTVLMRQAGLTVPGVYGPAAEEWGAYGIPAPR